ncbi:ABC transporter ATP-binding protein [Halorubrum lipolyticum]|uniref:ABC transporter-like protein n=1 Tax=Halorubrum lipolyticum DSM 21995 TaxID=1227482 RepID=M0NM45_9EURY|nr:ABC transporter ATP-binding protein [Halorubrum lipolyticum]EMA58229.1 ABC transporter-like protein [Halorubrum lipolyticum DSM 21995]
MPAIETDGLTKTYGDHTAIDEVTFTVRDGEVFGFLGPNGAGKSTTIGVLLGFVAPSRGTATVLGHDVETAPRAVRGRVGSLPDGDALYDELTGVEHLRLAGDLRGVDVDAAELVDRVGLSTEAAKRSAGTYSTGMRRRLALALALAGDPDLLVLDEPTSGLDPDGVSRLERIVRATADGGATVFFSSHALSHVEAVCDRVGILDGGRLAAVGSFDELRTTADAGAADRSLRALFDAYTSDRNSETARLGVRDGEVT